MNNHSELKSLSAEQVGQVLEWMGRMKLEEVVAKLAKPEPEGFGIRTSDSALSRLGKRAQRAECLVARAELAEEARGFVAGEMSEVDFGKASLAVLKQRLFETS